MKTILFISAAIFSLSVISAQTKLISHKSHSGSNTNFALALKGNLFNINESNLGHAPNRIVENAALDSVIYISEQEVILVTNKHNVDGFLDSSDSTVWVPGREIVVDHPLFSKNHSLDSIKQILKEQYNFKNDIDKTVFVGYDNKSKLYKKEKKKKEKFIIPVVLQSNDAPNKGWMILALGLLSFLGTWIFYRFSGNLRLTE